MRPIKIAIPASRGSFHDRAAIAYFGEQSVRTSASQMHSALQLVVSNATDYAVLACENTSAGMFYETYRLIDHSGLFVLDEIHLPVSLCLAARGDIELNKITKVISHPYALQQMNESLKLKLPAEFEPSSDTVSAAGETSRNTDRSVACICDPATAMHSGLTILLGDVQKAQPNYTRFFIVGKGNSMHEQYDKIIGRCKSSQQLQGLVRRIIHDGISDDKYFETNHLLHVPHTRIIGHSPERKPTEQVNNPIHISL